MDIGRNHIKTLGSVSILFLLTSLAFNNCGAPGKYESALKENDPIVRAISQSKTGQVSVIVGYHRSSDATQQKAGATRTQLLDLLKKGNEKFSKISGKSTTFRFRELPRLGLIEADVDSATYDEVSASDLVRTVILNREMKANSLTHASRVGAIATQDSGITGEGVTVAVIDSGVNGHHPLFKDDSGNSRVLQGSCIVTDSSCAGASERLETTEAYFPVTRTETGIHGTHVAGIIAARRDGGLTGVVPKAKIFPIRVTDANDGSNTFNIILALDHVSNVAEKHNIRAVNISMGAVNYGASNRRDCDIDNGYSNGDMGPFAELAKDLREKNVLIAVAAGNDSLKHAIGSPACVTGMIAVGAYEIIDSRFQIASFSNHSNFIDFMAPGVNVESPINASGTAIVSGTSQATPFVAGSMAALASRFPDNTAEEILGAMRRGVDYKVDGITDFPIAYLRVDKAVTALEQSKALYPLDDHDYQSTSYQNDSSEHKSFASTELNIASIMGGVTKRVSEVEDLGQFYQNTAAKMNSGSSLRLTFNGSLAGEYKIVYYIPKTFSEEDVLPKAKVSNSQISNFEIGFSQMDVYHAQSDVFYHDGTSSQIVFSASSSANWYIDRVDVLGLGSTIEIPDLSFGNGKEQVLRKQYQAVAGKTVLDIPKLERSTVGSYRWFRNNVQIEESSKPFIEFDQSQNLQGVYRVEFELDGIDGKYTSEDIYIENFDPASETHLTFEMNKVADKEARRLEVFYDGSLVEVINVDLDIKYASVVIGVPDADPGRISVEVIE